MKPNPFIAQCGICILALLSLAQAQTPPTEGAAGPPRPSSTRDPILLPGDSAPPPLQLLLQPSPPPGPPRPPNSTPSPSSTLAMEAVKAAVDACAADGLRVGAAVIDSAGVLRAGLSADGAAPGRIFVAARKGLTAIEFKAPSSAVVEHLKADSSLSAKIAPNMMPSPGAVPLMAENQLLGALGVSGATSEQDEKCATLGAAKIKARLK